MGILKRIIDFFDVDDDNNVEVTPVTTLRFRDDDRSDEKPPTEVIDTSRATTFDGTPRYAVEIRGTEYTGYSGRGSGIARLVLEPDNEASASAIMVHINGRKVGYVANEDTRIHSFLYLLEKKTGESVTTRYDRGFVFLPTIPAMVDMLRNEVETIFEAFDECFDENMEYESLYDEDMRALRDNLQNEIVKYKSEITCYDFPVELGRRIKPSNGYGYFSCDGLVFYWSCAAALLVNSYDLLHAIDAQHAKYEESRAKYEELQRKIKEDYAEIGTYAGVSRKHNITTHMVKKYLTTDFPEYQCYDSADWSVLDLSTFDVFVNHMDNLREWNRMWKIYGSSIETPYRPELKQRY